ncbi:Uncharacterized protein C16orf73 [Papilio machaon]|uniref:Uncharacterized protein C16orf73 n=1 Tax=Papilio machaon TaxID=76193 RepID=A0A0N0PBX3_PAPMA|nr:Uncharacterized protein C16orf73 [Papilio machaon]
MTGVQKVCLNNLNINIKNAFVIGIIIAKKCPRTFSPKEKSSELRGVMSFTIRDSQIDTINVDVWGSDNFVTTFYNRFIVGDVGNNLNNFKIFLFYLYKSVETKVCCS